MVKAVDLGYMTDEHENAITSSAMERWKKGRFDRTIKELSEFDSTKSERSLSQSHFDVNNSYPTSSLIVDLDFVYKQLLDGHIA